MLAKFFATALLMASVVSCKVPNCTEVTLMKEDIKNMFKKNNFHPGALRLGFHDCVDACDGCVNLDISSNAGLNLVVDDLEKTYQARNFDISRADYWALATIVAVDHGLELSNEKRDDGKKCPGAMKLSPLFGRTDNQDCSKQIDEEFPNPTMNYTVMMDYFKKQLNMTKEEVVVLMGAHSLGGAAPSGYTGHFTDGKTRFHFDERYYSQMIDARYHWKNENNDGPDKFVFNAYNSTTTDIFLGKMMFNTDFEMFYDLKLNETTSKTECNLNPLCGQDGSCASTDCPVAPVYTQSASYAKDCTKFLTDFEAALDKMMKVGVKAQLKECVAPTTTTTTTPSTPTTSSAGHLQMGLSLLLVSVLFRAF